MYGFVEACYCSFLLTIILWPLLNIHQVPGEMWHLPDVHFVPFSFLKALDILFPSTLLPFSKTLISAMTNAWLLLSSRQRLIFLFVNTIHTEAKFSAVLSCHLSHNCGWMREFENQAHPDSYKFCVNIWASALEQIQSRQRDGCPLSPQRHHHCGLPIKGGSENTLVCISGAISVEIRWYLMPLSPNLQNKSVFIPSQGHFAMKRKGAVEWRTMALIYNYNPSPRMMRYISIHQRQVSA